MWALRVEILLVVRLLVDQLISLGALAHQQMQQLAFVAVLHYTNCCAVRILCVEHTLACRDMAELQN